MRRREQETPSERYYRHRLRYLPGQIEACRHKLRALQNEARRYNMYDLIGDDDL